MNTKIITFLVLVLYCSMGCSDKKSTIRTGQDEPALLQTTETSGMKITEEILKHTFLVSYSVKDVELADAVEILNQQLKKDANLLSHEPVNFVVQNVVSKERVTLTTRYTSIRLICEVLAEQFGGYIEVSDFEVLFTRGDRDGIGDDDDDDESKIEQEALPALPK